MTSFPPSCTFEMPGPYRRFDSFMGEAMVARLLDYAAAREGYFQQTGVGNGQVRKINSEIRISRVLRDFGDLKFELETRFTAIFDFAVKELGISPIDLARLELELVAHGDGAFYREHIDTMTQRPNAKSDRALTGVYYFHRQPKGFGGGELRMHAIARPEAGGRFIDLVPDNDTLLLFPSWVPHEVRPVTCPSGNFLDSRFAINCWYLNRRKTA
jgi:Rps23 Pro-64 3,4-dihydroxylase Tpa1-like proline 4-hydroxylase